jgi:hypothetical protein
MLRAGTRRAYEGNRGATKPIDVGNTGISIQHIPGAAVGQPSDKINYPPGMAGLAEGGTTTYNRPLGLASGNLRNWYTPWNEWWGRPQQEIDTYNQQLQQAIAPMLAKLATVKGVTLPGQR